MSPRAKSITWRVVAVLFVVAMAVLCWHNIAQTLDAVFGTLQSVLDSWVGLREAYEAVGSSPGGFYYDPDGFTISIGWIIVGLAIGVLASAFGIGARLTRETEGLV
jgi:hypothetical protein